MQDEMVIVSVSAFSLDVLISVRCSFVVRTVNLIGWISGVGGVVFLESGYSHET